MSAFNNRLKVCEENGIVTNIEEIRSLLNTFSDYFGDEEYAYINSLITYLYNSDIKNKYPLIELLKQYSESRKLNSNVEATDYLKVVLGLNVGMCSFIENDETNYYLYYYDNNSLKVLECMQKYDLANYVNSYSNNFKPGFDIIGGYINYLKETLNFDPIPKEINIDNLKPSVKEIILTYLDKKKIQDYKIYIDSKNQIFAISGTAIIKYNSKTQEMYFLKSEDIFKNTLNEDTTDYDNIPYLLPFEIDKDRVDTILNNIDTLSSYDKRYLNSVIKTLIEKPDLVDDDVLECLTKYASILSNKINENDILTKVEKEFLNKLKIKQNNKKLEKKYKAGNVVIMLELSIIIIYLLVYIYLVK